MESRVSRGLAGRASAFRLLVVDDEPENLNVLEAVFDRAGYRVAVFPSGRAAVEEAARCPPDLALLDVNMPDMDGYEVCRLLKSNPATAVVPVIFISAMDSTEDKILAFEAGAVDYLTKPFCAREVLKRVEVQLSVRRLQAELERHNHELEDRVRERTAELAEAHRQLLIWNQAKTGWLQMVSHEMRTPMTGLLGVTDLLAAEIGPGSPLEDLASTYRGARDRMMRLIEDASLLTGIQVGSASLLWTTVDLCDALREAIAGRLPEAAPTTFDTTAPCPGRIGILGDAGLVRRALSGMLWTAVCCVPGGEVVRVVPSATEDRAEVRFIIAGDRLLPGAAGTLFEVCGRQEVVRAGGDLGLAPVLARQVARLLGGDADVIPMPDGQTALRVWLRRMAPAPDGEESP